MRTQVHSGHDTAAIFRAVDDAIGRGFRPTLAVAFCSVSLDVTALRRGFDERAIALIGATTSGEIANDTVLNEACVTILMELHPSAFTIALHGMGAGDCMFELGRRLGRHAVDRFANPVVLAFGAGVRTNGEPAVHGVRAGAGRPIPMFGGMAGDNLAMMDTYVFSTDRITDEGLVGLVLDGNRVRVDGLATSGWRPVGVERTVTCSDGHVVHTIDGESALDVYLKHLNVDVTHAGDGEVTALSLGVHYPLSVLRANGTRVIRAPLACRPGSGSLIFAGIVPQGSRVMFCIPPSLAIVARVVGEAGRMQASMPRADALILVSCKARQLALGPLAGDEIRAIRALWDAPMAGFFSYGEIGARDPSECDFHMETCALVALHER